MKRIIGQYGGDRPGPLVVVTGALHGNEPAGVQALEEVFLWLHQVAGRQPGFEFSGQLIGLIGHRQAFERHLRFIQQDLNRLWLPATVQHLLDKNPVHLHDEALEIRELHTAICQAVQAEMPETLILLDLHTTSAGGGIFCIPTDEADSLALARGMHTPVILDLFEGISGTLLGFATEGHFRQGRYPGRTLGVAFEAGQHQDPISVSRSVSAILHCLQAAGCIGPEAVGSRHAAILQQYSVGLPQVTRLQYVHGVQAGDQFRMRPGYRNFQLIQVGEHLADDRAGPVYASCDGLILMPLYQPQGADGFFVVTEV